MRALVRARLVNQRLSRPARATVVEVVAWFGAVQAQEYAMARWGVGQRAPGLTDADVQRAFDAGDILRTHVMRPTWHFVAPGDIRWLLALTAPRVKALMAPYDRRLELDAAVFAKSQRIFVRALAGGSFLTRTELAVHLERAGITAAGQRLAHIVMRAELDALICSGPRRGKQFTYALLDERAPRAGRLDRDGALAELARRYFMSHGPATLRDFAWWSGLTVRDAKIGAETLGAAMDHRVVDDLTFWFAGSQPLPRRTAAPTAHLLPIYDECLIAYKDRDPVAKRMMDRTSADSGRDTFANLVLLDGRLAGTWRATAGSKSVAIEVGLYRRPAAGEIDRLEEQGRRYGRFIESPVTVSVRRA